VKTGSITRREVKQMRKRQRRIRNTRKDCNAHKGSLRARLA